MKRPLPTFLGVLVALCALGPQAARADEPEPVHRYVDDQRPPPPTRAKVLLAGTLVTGAFYAPVLGASYLWPEHGGAKEMRIPVAGPWLGFSRTKLCNATPDIKPCNNFLRVTGAVLLVLDGLGQAGGVGLILESMFMSTGPSRAVRSEEAYLRYPSFRPARASLPLTFQRGDLRVTPMPLVNSETDFGLGFLGTF